MLFQNITVNLQVERLKKGFNMEAVLNQNYIVDNYWNLLKGLSDNIKLALISKLSSSIAMKAEDKKSKSMKLSDFYGVLEDTDFPSASEIREVMQDEDKDINQFCL